MTSPSPDSKLVLRNENDDGSVDVETPWASSLGEDLYVLENSPFYAYDVSWQDVVYAPFDADEERPLFRNVHRKSGNRTIRVIFSPPVEDGNPSDKLLKEIVNLGCSYEGATSSYIALNIPPEIDLKVVSGFLTDQNIQWEHADPSYEKLYGSDV